MDAQRDAAPAEGDPLLLQQDPLRQHAGDARPRADPALRVHHPMPRKIRGAAPHRPADGARRAGPPEERRELAVRGHAPARNLPDEPVDRAPEG
jgi:hypothetical protein